MAARKDRRIGSVKGMAVLERFPFGWRTTEPDALAREQAESLASASGSDGNAKVKRSIYEPLGRIPAARVISQSRTHPRLVLVGMKH